MKSRENHGKIEKMVLTYKNMYLSQKETEPGVQKGDRSLLACQTRRKCSKETFRKSVKDEIGIKVIKLM